MITFLISFLTLNSESSSVSEMFIKTNAYSQLLLEKRENKIYKIY